MAKEKQALTKLRIDKWLWAARFFKTRRIASDAISGGKVHVNGQRVKPSKEVHINDTLQINKVGLSWEITILGLNAQRRPANEATKLYDEDEKSLKRRQELIALNKDMYASAPQSERPNKKQRRQIHRFKQAD
ncbi:MAG TPA: RNA-binding protein [Cycloclasticus sp.]|nr:RNA-binding protein [Cycloclasticus sp.]HIL92997.1 RNA-binding protein [Cycloclasticus sp.]